MTDFGSQLRAARIAAGMSQTEAARRAGLRQSLWSDYERGQKSPSIVQAERLARAVVGTDICGSAIAQLQGAENGRLRLMNDIQTQRVTR